VTSRGRASQVIRGPRRKNNPGDLKKIPKVINDTKGKEVKKERTSSPEGNY
jgi:hypothetical protein